ncbi:MAG TPA: hypothetical protein VGJ63_01010, partial [Micromonosporaceae bacterium]
MTMRTIAMRRPGFRSASEDRAGLTVAQLQLHPPRVTTGERVAPLRRDHRDTRATAQRERPHRDYSVPTTPCRRPAGAAAA